MENETNGQRIVKIHKMFEGRPPYHLMPILLSEGHKPISIATAMDIRLDNIRMDSNFDKEDEETRNNKMAFNRTVYRNTELETDNLWDKGIDTCDAIAAYTTCDVAALKEDGHAKIVLDSSDALSLTPRSRILHGSLAFPDGHYEALKGLDLTQEMWKKYVTYDDQTKEEVLKNELWIYLARDEKRLKAYVDFVFHPETKQKYGYDTAMGLGVFLPNDIYFAEDEGPYPSSIMQFWHLGNLHCGSMASGGAHLGYDGRLIGEKTAAYQTKISR